MAWLTFSGGTSEQRRSIEAALEQHRPNLHHGSIRRFAEALEMRLVVWFMHAQNPSAFPEPAHDKTLVAVSNDMSVKSYRTALDNGAAGVLSANAHPDHLAAVFTSALRQDLLIPRSVWPAADKFLAEQQLPTLSRAILDGLANGLSTKQLAQHLGYSERTARRRIANLCLELGADSPSQLVRLALQRGLL